MKKIVLLVSSIAVLAGCAAGIDTSEPVEKRADLDRVCIQEKKTGLNFTSTELVEFIRSSLSKKQIKSEVYAKDANCKYLLSYATKGKKELIVRGKLVLSELNATGRSRIGEVSYKYRGEEKELAKATGIQGQFDKMVGELFKNY